MCKELKGKSVLVYDIETDSLETDEANLKWFGAYSYKNDEYYVLDYTQKEDILRLLSQHKVYVGFNNEEFDNPILERMDDTINFTYSPIADLYKISKRRLKQMRIELKNHKLKTIVKELNLDDDGKGDIDYNIFKKDLWSKKEREEIKSYLIKDVEITKKLFEWYFNLFYPVRELLSKKDRDNFQEVRASPSSLAYRAILSHAGVKYEFSDYNNKKKKRMGYLGGHHIEARRKKAKGNILSIDFSSQYPHAIVMYNLLSRDDENGESNFNIKLEGKYNVKKQGYIEQSLMDLLQKRLEAKEEGDIKRDKSFKLCCNSFSGALGNESFKTIYDPVAAGDMTYIGRTWLKLLAQMLEQNGCYILYGFTDGLYCLVPPHLSTEEVMHSVKKLKNWLNRNAPFPQPTFDIDLDGEYKFMWFVAKNIYLWVDKDDNVGYKSTLLNKTTPKIIMRVFNEYMAPKIKKELDVNFTDSELIKQIRERLKGDITLATSEYNVRKKENYDVKTSLYYQISTRYGSGKHMLIPNNAGVGVGRGKGSKKKRGVRYCTVEEFKKNNLEIKDVDISKLIKHLDEFYSEKNKDTNLDAYIKAHSTHYTYEVPYQLKGGVN